jgi:hypothetical protein
MHGHIPARPFKHAWLISLWLIGSSVAGSASEPTASSGAALASEEHGHCEKREGCRQDANLSSDRSGGGFKAKLRAAGIAFVDVPRMGAFWSGPDVAVGAGTTKSLPKAPRIIHKVRMYVNCLCSRSRIGIWCSSRRLSLTCSASTSLIVEWQAGKNLAAIKKWSKPGYLHSACSGSISPMTRFTRGNK